MAFDEWNTRIAWNVRHRRWWWSAWKPSTRTELWGFVESKEQAFQAMTAAIKQHDRRDASRSGDPAYW